MIAQLGSLRVSLTRVFVMISPTKASSEHHFHRRHPTLGAKQ
jgi:hypothetical protein